MKISPPTVPHDEGHKPGIQIYRNPEPSFWLEQKQKVVSASEIAALANKDPYKSLPGLFYLKTRQMPPPAQTAAMKEGKAAETAIIAAIKARSLADDEWQDLAAIKASTDYFEDPSKRVGATPDAFAGDIVVELKNVSRRGWLSDKVWNKGKSGLPPVYACQLQIQMGLAGKTKGVLVAQVHHTDTYRELHKYNVDYRPDEYEGLVGLIAAFWAKVEKQEVPPGELTSRERTSFMNGLANQEWATGKTDLSNQPIENVIDAYETASDIITSLRRQVAEHEEFKKRAKLEILMALDGNCKGLFNSREITIKKITTKAFAVEEKSRLDVKIKDRD